MMESEEWSVCQGVIYGLRDSIVGISALWRVPGKETTPPGAKEKEDSKSDKQKTTLERRREQNRRETTKERMEVRRKVNLHYVYLVIYKNSVFYLFLTLFGEDHDTKFEKRFLKASCLWILS
jgi:hypothetical protein